jgi:hypothetical protein
VEGETEEETEAEGDFVADTLDVTEDEVVGETEMLAVTEPVFEELVDGVVVPVSDGDVVPVTLPVFVVEGETELLGDIEGDTVVLVVMEGDCNGRNEKAA